MPEFDFDAYLDTIMPRTLSDSESVIIYTLPYNQKFTNLLRGPKRVEEKSKFLYPASS